MIAPGVFVRLNAHLLNTTEIGDGKIISIVGTMEATDGQTMTLKTSDGQPLIYIMGDLDFEKVRMHAIFASQEWLIIERLVFFMVD